MGLLLLCNKVAIAIELPDLLHVNRCGEYLTFIFSYITLHDRVMPLKGYL